MSWKTIGTVAVSIILSIPLPFSATVSEVALGVLASRVPANAREVDREMDPAAKVLKVVTGYSVLMLSGTDWAERIQYGTGRSEPSELTSDLTGGLGVSRNP